MTYDPDLILTDSNLEQVFTFLQNHGWHLAELTHMSSVRLINVYHSSQDFPSPTAAQRAAAVDFLALLNGKRPGTPAGPEMTHYRTDLVIQIASLAHPVLLVGPAGCGKTTIGEHVAAALRLPFYITNTINDTHELVGFVDGHGKYHGTPFREAFEHGGLWIADEIDAWDANALLAANSALANGYCNFPDRSDRVVRHNDFRMIATANTFGNGADRVYVGRNELDAASLDRFATVDVDYDLNLEHHFARGQTQWYNHVQSTRRIVTEKKIRHIVSSRAIRMGADALIAGLSWGDVCEIYLLKGMSSKDRGKLKDD